jgi:uncharacterized protein (TIGR03437 family)
MDVAGGPISTLSCNPDLGTAGALACTVALDQPALSDTTVSLQADSSQVQIPAQVRIPAGTSSAQFAAAVQASDQDLQFKITAAMQGAARSIPVAVLGIKPIRLACASLVVQAGDPLTCAVRLTASNVPGVARLNISSGNAGLMLPGSITTRPGQTDLSFNVSTDALAPQQPSAIVVRFGQSEAATIITVTGGVNPVLTLPGRQHAMIGNAMNFTVTAADPNAVPLTLSAMNLPLGAAFDESTGLFSWAPDPSQKGLYTVTFIATNTTGGTATGDVVIQVDEGRPVIEDVRNGASQGSGTVCNAGSVATLLGRWLASANPPASDPTGSSTQLADVKVNSNGSYVPVLYASATRIDFVCPVADPGTTLNIAVENGAGTSNSMQATIQPIAPGIFSADRTGRGQGLVTLLGTSLLATPRTYLNLGQPAEPGDSIAILATGLDPTVGVLPQIMIGEAAVAASSVEAIPSLAGVYQIVAKLPAGLPVGDALPLQVSVTAPDGTVLQTNTVTIAVESARPIN